MKNNCYKFVGVINFFGVCPDFVYPIFEKEGKYYFQKTSNTLIISFNEIKDNLRTKMINFLDKETTKFINIKDGYYIGNEAVVAFQTDIDEFLISDTSYFVSFISKFVTEDHILIEEIDAFLDNVKRKKLLKKTKC